MNSSPNGPKPNPPTAQAAALSPSAGLGRHEIVPVMDQVQLSDSPEPRGNPLALALPV